MSIRVLSLLIILFISCECLRAQSNERWLYLDADDEGKYYVDKETLDYNSTFGSYTLWVKYIYKIPKYNNHNSKYTDYELYTWVVYCKTRKIYEKEYYIYYEDGTYYNSTINETYSIPPESIGETLYNVLCK